MGGGRRVINQCGEKSPRTKQNIMKAIKGIKGLKRVLEAQGFRVIEDNKKDMIIIEKRGKLIDIKEDMQNALLKTHRVSYLNVFSNGENYVVDVKFY